MYHWTRRVGQWANKDALLAQTGLALLAQPIQDHLDALKGQLEERIGTVNQRISAGENSHLHLTATGKCKSWTLQYPTSDEPINHPIFETLRQVNISRVLHFVNYHCQFMMCFEHVLGRYTLVANHVPVNAEMIGAHDHESQFVFDLLFNNTTDIHTARCIPLARTGSTR